ncbi:hypothetical protein SFR_4558 [Streptomyces sp. FR-008]|nr:hypothetical protein SFR_4558 [Streptomyces sp. FR-008]
MVADGRELRRVPRIAESATFVRPHKGVRADKAAPPAPLVRAVPARPASP